MKELEKLSQELKLVSGEFQQRFQIAESREMSQALKELSKRYDSASVPQDLVENVLRKIRKGQSPSTWTEMKYLCFGLTRALEGESWVLLEDSKAFNRAMIAIQNTGDNPASLKRCYQGLLYNYFIYPGGRDSAHEIGRKNWNTIRSFLQHNLDRVLVVKPVSEWLEVLREHKNLLENDPCKRYAKAYLVGDTSELKKVSTLLNLPEKSWVWEAVILSGADVLLEKNDEEYKKGLDSFLALLGGISNLVIPEQVIIRGLAKLIIRYSECVNQAVHERLRDLSVSKIGNPWLRRDAWQGYVSNEKAREMVNGWLKKRLITDFFGILSDGGDTDSRRLKFWMKFEPMVTDLWILLCPFAMDKRDSNFKELRNRARGRLLKLNTMTDQNAFIMKIGKYYVVEFGKVGRAFFYEERQLPFRLDVPDGTSIHEGYTKGGLKSDNGHKMSHMQKWEDDFQSWLCPKLNWWPPSSKIQQSPVISSRPASHNASPDPVRASEVTAVSDKLSSRAKRNMNGWLDTEYAELYEYVEKFKLAIRDMRHQGGVVWVLTKDEKSPAGDYLKRCGFKFKENKGWWKE